jgi:hypothetical protein
MAGAAMQALAGTADRAPTDWCTLDDKCWALLDGDPSVRRPVVGPSFASALSSSSSFLASSFLICLSYLFCAFSSLFFPRSSCCLFGLFPFFVYVRQQGNKFEGVRLGPGSAERDNSGAILHCGPDDMK